MDAEMPGRGLEETRAEGEMWAGFRGRGIRDHRCSCGGRQAVGRVWAEGLEMGRERMGGIWHTNE